MNRIITILVTIFILLLLYIWISHVWGSDKPRHPRQIVDARESETLGADDLSTDMDSSLIGDALTDDGDSYSEENSNVITGEETTLENVEPLNSEPEEAEEEVKVVEQKKVAPPKPEPKVETKPKVTTTPPATKTSQPIAKPKTVTASTDGKHLVIVGNFLQVANANQRAEELKKAGFNEVEVVNFDLSEYHTVTAGRFDDVNEARRLVKKLKDYHKIDAYVRIGS